MADETIDDGDSAAAKSVAADIASFGKSRELSDEEFVQQLAIRQAADQRRLRYEQECRIQHQQELAEAEAKAAADAERQARQAAIADAEARQRAGREAMERSQRGRELGSIYDRLTRAEQFRNRVTATARQQAAINQRQALIADLQSDIDAMIPKPSEPTIIIVERTEEGSADFGPDFDPALFNKKPRSWW